MPDMLADADFAFVAGHAKTHFGLALPPARAPYVEQKLNALTRREGLLSVHELITTARAGQDSHLLSAITESLTNPDTQFFRDRMVFAHLRDVLLPELAAARGRPLRILSVGCSTGQEPYSLAIMLEELKLQAREIETQIFAFDCAPRAIERARDGLYSQFEVQRGLSIKMLIRHFEKSGDNWRIADRLRAKVKFDYGNLNADFSGAGAFDLILCRNVLASFDEAARLAALVRLRSALAPDGWLLLGATETEQADGFRTGSEQPGLFRLGAASRAA